MAPPKIPWSKVEVVTRAVSEAAKNTPAAKLKLPAGSPSEIAGNLFGDELSRAVAGDKVMEAGKDISPPVSESAKKQWAGIKQATGDYGYGEPGAEEAIRFSRELTPDYEKVAPTARSWEVTGHDQHVTSADRAALTRTWEAEHAQDAQRNTDYGQQVMGAAATVGAGALALGAGSAQAAPSNKYSPEFFDELEKSSPEDIASFMGQLSEAEQNEVVSAAESWKAGKTKPDGGMSWASRLEQDRLIGAAGGKGFEDPAQQMSVAGPAQNGGMNEPFISHVKSPSGRSWLRINHKQVELSPNATRMPGAYEALRSIMLPGLGTSVGMMKQTAELADAAKTLVADPAVEATQEQLRKTPFASIKKATGIESPATDYLYKSATQWVFGKSNFEDISPEEHLQAINDLSEVAKHPLFKFAMNGGPAGVLPGMLTKAVGNAAGVRTEMTDVEREAMLPAIAEYAGEAPMMMWSGGRALTMAAAEAPIMGGALMGGVLGGVDALIHPGRSLSEGVQGGMLGGGAVGGVVKAGIKGFLATKYVAEAANDLWSMTEGLKKLSPVKPVAPSMFADVNAKLMEGQTVFAAERATENAIMGGIADATPVSEFKVVPFTPNQKFYPSTALVGPGSVRFFEFRSGTKPRVMEVPLNSEANAKWVDTFLDKHLVDPIPTDGALESTNRFVKDFMTGDRELSVKGKDGAVYGNRIGMSDSTNAGAGRKLSVSPAVVEESEDGFIDLYRLTSQKARERAIAVQRPVEATSLAGGTKVRGYLVQSADGAYVHPGDEMDGVMSFVDQIVPISVNKPVRPLSPQEIREAAVMTPLQRKDAMALASKFDPRYSAEGGASKLVDDARVFLAQYVEKNPQYMKLFKQAMKDAVTGEGKVTKKERAKVRQFIAAEQRINNYEDVSSVPIDAALVFDQYVKKLPAMENNQSARDTIRRLLASEFKLSKELSEVVALDAMNLTKVPAPGSVDYKYRMDLIQNWMKVPELPAVLPRAVRPQFTMPPTALPEDAARVGQMQLQGALGEAAGSGQNVFVSGPDGVGGYVVDHTANRVTIETPSGLKQIPMELAQLSEPPPEAVNVYGNDINGFIEDVASAIRNSPEDRELMSAIINQARQDGIPQDGIMKAVMTATQRADDPMLTLAKPPAPPAPPAEPPPPPGEGPPPNGGFFPDPAELGIAKAGLSDPSALDRMVKYIWGPRAVVPDNLAKAVNLVMGAQNLERTVTRTVEAAQRQFGMKMMADFDKAFIRTLNGSGTMDDLKTAYPSIMKNSEIEKTVTAAIREKATNALKLNELGLLDDVHVETDDLRNYITRLYARRFLPAGEWAAIAQQNKQLMADGRDVFTRMLEKQGLKGEELRQAAEANLLEFIGARDVQKSKELESALRGGPSKAQSALKQSPLDALEEELTTTMGLNGLRPQDVDTMRRLLGANESGMLAMATTLAKQKALIARGMMWRQVTTEMPEFFSQTARPMWPQLPMNRSLYGDAAGKYIHPDAHEALVAVPQYVATNNRILLGLSSWVKGNQVALGGVSTFNTNFFGSMKGAVLSGGMDVMTGARLPHMKTAADMLLKARTNPLGPEAGLLDDIIRIGVDAPSFNATEVNGIQKDQAVALLRDISGSRPLTVVDLSKRAIKMAQKPAEVAGAFYDTMDRLWKIGSYLSLLEKGGLGKGGVDLQKAYKFLRMNSEVKAYNRTLPKSARGVLPPDFRMNEAALIEAIKQEAALRVTSSFPMPDRVSPAMQKARGAVGVVAPYLTYKSEEARVNYAIMHRIKRGEYDLMFRLFGVGVASVGTAKLSRELGKMNGISDADVTEANDMDSPSNKKYRPGRLAMPVRDALGRVQYMDFTQYNDWLGTVAQLQSNDPVETKVKNVIGNVLTFPFSGSDSEDYGQELAWRAGLADQPFSPKLRTDQKGMTAVLDGMSRTGVLPKMSAWGYDIYRDASQPENGKYEKATPGQAALRAAGFKTWGVGDASKRARNMESIGGVLGAVRDMKSVAKTPDGTVQREVGAGVLDKTEAMKENYEQLKKKQEERGKLLNPKR